MDVYEFLNGYRSALQEEDETYGYDLAAARRPYRFYDYTDNVVSGDEEYGCFEDTECYYEQ